MAKKEPVYIEVPIDEIELNPDNPREISPKEWNKNQSVMGRKDYQPMHELIFYGWVGKHRYYGTKDKSILNCPKPQANKLHPTMKPPQLLRKLIYHATEKGMIVYDAFGGSGSTLIACEQWSDVIKAIATLEEAAAFEEMLRTDGMTFLSTLGLEKYSDLSTLMRAKLRELNGGTSL